MTTRFKVFTSCWPSKCLQALLAILAICILVAVPSIASAQWRRLMNPQIPVSIEHPPKYVLSTDKIIIAPAVGSPSRPGTIRIRFRTDEITVAPVIRDCGSDITSELIAGFAERESEVLGPEELALILKALDLGAPSGDALDKDAALAVGRHVGPGTLLRIRSTKCDSERSSSSRTVEKKVGKGDDAETIEVKMIRSTTHFHLGFSVNVTNLATGVTHAAETFSYSTWEYNESEGDRPDYPSEAPLKESALRSVVPGVSKLLFPWTQVKKITFFDGVKRTCNLKLAHLALVSGDNQRALELSEENIELCNSERKASKTIRSNAYYNAGVMYRVGGEFDTALEYLWEAAELRPGAGIIKEAIKECNDAKAKRQAMLRFAEETDEQREALQAEIAKTEAAQEEAAEQAQRAKQALTNEEIALAVQSELPEEIILARIEASDCDFDLSIEALAALHEAGVPKSVITAMIACGQ